MKIDKNNEVIQKLVQVAGGPRHLSSSQSVEECACVVACEPGVSDHGRELEAIVAIVKQHTHYSSGEIENALSDLEKAGILQSRRTADPTVTTQTKFYQPTLEFLRLMAGEVKRNQPALFEISIKVKGNDVTLKDLHFFYKNVNWLLETQPDLKYLWVGPSKLTREEAAGLKAHLVAHHPFGE